MFDRILTTPLSYLVKLQAFSFQPTSILKKWTPSQVFFKDFGNLAGTPI